jgi:hypothetical protein
MKAYVFKHYCTFFFLTLSTLLYYTYQENCHCHKGDNNNYHFIITILLWTNNHFWTVIIYKSFQHWLNNIRIEYSLCPLKLFIDDHTARVFNSYNLNKVSKAPWCGYTILKPVCKVSEVILHRMPHHKQAQSLPSQQDPQNKDRKPANLTLDQVWRNGGVTHQHKHPLNHTFSI